MPTYNSVTDDAENCYQAMRSLAHRTARVTSLAELSELYWLLGALNGTARCLQQVLYQVANTHRDRADDAVTDGGSRTEGHLHALRTCREVRRAADLLTNMETFLDAGQSQAGRIAWQKPVNSPGARSESAAQPGYANGSASAESAQSAGPIL